MKNNYLFRCLLMIGVFTVSAFGQQTIVVNDPLKDAKPVKPNAVDENLIRNNILPKARKYFTSETCSDEFETIGMIKGSFTKSGSDQTLVFYQYCQYGNGYGNNGLVLIENGKIAANYVSQGGWAFNIKKLPDINRNGLNEFALYYSGGIHQGEGGAGVDVWEFSAMNLKGIGWFQADSFTENSSASYKVSVKTGKIPLFYREKYISRDEKNWRKSGMMTKLALDKIACDFTVLK